MHRFSIAAILILSFVAAGCHSNTGLAPATEINLVDTTTVFALRGTAVVDPSGFSIPDRIAVRTDETAAFDFAFDFKDDGTPIFLPLQVLGLGSLSGTTPGLEPTVTPFDQITKAETNSYVFDDTIPIAVGNVFYGRSRIVCTTLTIPMYGKIEVLSIDTVARSVTFRFLSNLNCGYLGLEPGIPNN
jgi:hypothetical protein